MLEGWDLSSAPVSPSKHSEGVKSSKFLDDLYNVPGKHDKVKKAIDEFILKQVEERQKQLENDANYKTTVMPLGFKQPMLLSVNEEKVIADAVLQMARSIHNGSYILQNECRITRIEVDDQQQKDVPMPHIRLTIIHPINITPKHGFYLRGSFKKERLMREIVEAHIDKIVFNTEDGVEHTLLTL